MPQCVREEQIKLRIQRFGVVVAVMAIRLEAEVGPERPGRADGEVVDRANVARVARALTANACIRVYGMAADRHEQRDGTNENERTEAPGETTNAHRRPHFLRYVVHDSW